MSENILIILIAVLFYPAIVLVIALTGPHSESERRELRRRPTPTADIPDTTQDGQ